MKERRLHHYKKYLELKGYQKSSIRGLLKRAELYETKTSNHILSLKPSTLQLYYYQKKTYLHYLSEVEKEVHYLQEEHHKKEVLPIEILTIEQIQELFTTSKTLREQVVLHCLYSLGLRLSEVSNIELEDIDREKKILLVKKSKTKKQRQVPMNSNSLQVLVAYIEQERPIDKGNKLIQGLKGDVTSDGIYQILKKLAQRTSLKKRIYPHLLRHSISSHLLSRGMDLEQISKFLGHSSVESTQRYTHLENSK
jgi:site-specific recombinase XerD